MALRASQARDSTRDNIMRESKEHHYYRLTLKGEAVNRNADHDGERIKVMQISNDSQGISLATRTMVWALNNGCEFNLTEI